MRALGAWIQIALVASALALSAGARAAEEIVLGVPVPLTGGLAEGGRDMRDGLQLYLDQHNGAFGGVPVRVVVEDTAGTPTIALTKVRKLVELDKSDLIMGLYLASEGYAVRDYVTQQRVPLILPVVAADDLTQRQRSPYILRLTATSSQVNHAFGAYAYQKLGYRRVVTIGQDYAFGYENVGGFQRVFEEMGGQVVQKLWAPLGTPDYAPYISQIRRDVDAVYVLLVGADIPRFFTQYRDYGVGLPVIGGIAVMDEDSLRHMRDEAYGVLTAHVYSPELSRVENVAFVDAFAKRYGRLPSYFAEAMYTAAMWLDRVIQSRGWPLAAEKLIQAFRQVRLEDAPRGPLALDDYNNTIETVYIRKVVPGPSRRPVNQIVDAIPNVSQFWTYAPESYMAGPPYSRDFPSCRFCR